MNEKKYCIVKLTFQKKEILLQYQEKEKIKEISLFPSVYTQFYLYEGKEVLEKEWRDILQANDLAKDVDYAYSCVGKRSYTVAQLSKKMQQKGISLSHIHSIIQTLKEQNLLNDDRYQEEYVEILEAKLYGRRRICEELKKVGISQEKIDALVLDEEKEYEKAQTLLSMLLKRPSKESNVKRRVHLEMDLYRYGYDREMISRVLQEISLLSLEEEKKNCLIEKRKYERIYAQQENQTRKRRIIASLMRKGYSYDIIKQVMEENEDELD